MIKKLFGLLQAVLMLSLLSCSIVSCGDKKDDPTPDPTPGVSTELNITLPASVDVVVGEDCRIAQGANGVVTSDLIYLEKDGKITACTVTEATEDHFSFRLPTNFEGGTFKVIVKRGDRRITLGNLTITMVKYKFDLLPTTTVYGVVEAADGPIPGVVVSDGVETTVTDEKGIYQLASKKESGFVFISVPSGYECQLSGVFPDHYRTFAGKANEPENQSFTLKKVDQSNYRVIFLGDMHLANRAKGGTASNADNTQFKTIASDINKYVAANGGTPTYFITLGDMTWDLYWYSCNYDLAEYKKTVNEQLNGHHIYHTIGNHDNDMNAIGQFAAKNPFAVNVAPPYYSFNIGSVHYVVMDNVDCEKYVGGGSANRDNQIFGKIYGAQYEWLKKDLSYVDKSTPVVVTMHVPVFNDSKPAVFALKTIYSQQTLDAFSGYNVHFVTGHTHRNYNALPGNSGNSTNFYEHNVSAICSDWWWSGAKSPGYLMAPDGTPCGYSVWNISGKDLKWIYKTAGKDENFQFRSYDLNMLDFSAADVTGGVSSKYSGDFNKMIADYSGNKKNEVLLNIWNYNTKWTVSVKTADGKELPVSHVSAYDPLHIKANVFKRWSSSDTSKPIGSTTLDHHFFKVVAPDADTDLVITVKDEFGHVWTENMNRPKAMNDENYKITIK